ncbi:cilia- and flagella-associated protein 69-like [Cololabis saira]|uniref:cilia- and flagella-associated protein 69-like n=1 Tax=Cololabis saira TaxID=129043 RepID=UPI002AD42A42|nr:cilia- and flagella-associated protein 69-like [Cololabis saira]
MDSGKTVHRRNTDIPAISLVSTKRLDLSKVIRLLEDPLTTTFKEKHLFVLKKLLKRHQAGFLLRELKGIAQVLNICAEKVKEHPEFVPILCEALKICGLPFLKERVSDELDYAQDATDFLSHMAYLMRVSDADVKHHVVESVKSFFSCKAPAQLLDGLQPTSRGFRLQVLEQSDLGKTLLLSMVTLENQPGIRLQLLETLQILSSSSDCASILQGRGAETICLHMIEPDPSGKVLSYSSEILCNLLEKGQQEARAQLSNTGCIISLQVAFHKLLLSASQPSDLQLRNDLLVIATHVAEDSNSLLTETLFAKHLVDLFTRKEPKPHSSSAHNSKVTCSNEDLKMQKLLLNLLVFMCRDVDGLQLCKEEQVMTALLELIKPPGVSSEPPPGSGHWSPVQQEKLQLQALATLASIAPLMLDDYKSSQGNTCLLLLLDWCVRTDDDLVLGPGGGGGRTALMQYCIRVLRAVTSQREESVNRDLRNQGVIHQLLGILMQMEARSEEDDAVTVETMSDIQMILLELCATDRKDLFGSTGADMALHFLRKGSGKFYSGLGHNKLILSTINCVWSCIVDCYMTEDYFLAKEGAFLLLDLLGTSPRCVQSTVLSILLDLCDNPKALPHIMSWRDASGQTAAGVLLQLWREEEEELGVGRDHRGRIADPQMPISRPFHRDDGGLSLPANVQNAAVLEVSEKIRAKIYSILCSLGFQELPDLSAEDFVTLSIVKRYLDFKVGEVWDEIRQELVLEGVRPVSPDEEALRSICRISEDTAKRVMEEQSSILEQQQQKELSDEMLEYTKMKFRQKPEELAAKSWKHFLSKSSNYKFLKEEKAQREKYLKPIRSELEQEDASLYPAEVLHTHTSLIQSLTLFTPKLTYESGAASRRLSAIFGADPGNGANGIPGARRVEGDAGQNSNQGRTCSTRARTPQHGQKLMLPRHQYVVRIRFKLSS